jgi:hypothetical protein
MLKWEPFHYKNLDEIRKDRGAGRRPAVDEDLSVFTKPIKGKRDSAENRLAIQPLEGFDADRDGTPPNLRSGVTAGCRREVPASYGWSLLHANALQPDQPLAAAYHRKKPARFQTAG